LQKVEFLIVKLFGTELYTKSSPYRTVTTLRLCYKNQSVNVV